MNLRSTSTGALLAACALLSTSRGSAATFLISDVTHWTGAGASAAVLVLDWSDGQPAWAWGYRWDAAQPKTGADLLAAVLGAEPALSAQISGAGFVSNIGWHGTNRFQGDYNPNTGAYWNYFVNNAQQNGVYTDGAAPTGAHVLPPLGSPYDEAGPGMWVSSNTGILGRPLVDGAWDGLVYADFSSAGPGLATNVPEPTGLLLGVVFLVMRRRRA